MLQVSAGFDSTTGKRQRITRTVRGSKKEAQTELTRLLSEIDRGTAPVVGTQTVSEYLDSWLNNVVSNRNRPRTLDSYRIIVERHLNPQIGSIRLHDLAAVHVQQVLSAARASGLSESTALRIFTVLRKALTDAERSGIQTRQPTRLVEPPHPERYRVEMPQIESIKKIVKIARPNHRGAIIEFMANTGVRRGEAIALRWSDIGIVSKTAQINGSMQRIKHQGLKFVPTKSAAGRRAVALNSDALRVVNRRRIQQTEDRLKAGSEFTDNDLVFTTESGLPLDPDNLTHQFKRFAVKAGHPNLRLHDLRHFHAYALALSGAHPKVIQNQLGHASAAFTLQVYTHVDASLQAAAVQRTSGLLG